MLRAERKSNNRDIEYIDSANKFATLQPQLVVLKSKNKGELSSPI